MAASTTPKSYRPLGTSLYFPIARRQGTWLSCVAHLIILYSDGACIALTSCVLASTKACASPFLRAFSHWHKHLSYEGVVPCDGVEPPEPRGTWSTARPASTYGLPRDILFYKYYRIFFIKNQKENFT